jgi:hypothetical protein
VKAVNQHQKPLKKEVANLISSYSSKCWGDKFENEGICLSPISSNEGVSDY